VDGGVLVIDKNQEFKNHIAEMLAPRKLKVDYASDEELALARCKLQKISVVLVNTSTPGIEPYRLCKRIKSEVADRVTVVLLVGKSFPYDAERARDAGCDGYLVKPIPNRHLMSAFKKFLPTFWR
jgi:CheY-like chemotaxis protein